MLERIDEALAELLAMPDPVLSSTERMERFLQQAPSRVFRRKDYLTFFPGLSTATATRDLAEAVQAGLLERKGEKRRASYLRI